MIPFPHYRWKTKNAGVAMTEERENLPMGYLFTRQLSINHYLQESRGTIHHGIKEQDTERQQETEIAHS